MPEANVNDRASIEHLYPRGDFERDAAENSDAKATVHRGIRIVSPVAADGRFSLERASRHVGEADPEGDAVFLAPFLPDTYAPRRPGDAHGGPVLIGDPADTAARKEADYRDFISAIADAAKAAEFKPAIGLGESRLRGFHGG